MKKETCKICGGRGTHKMSCPEVKSTVNVTDTPLGVPPPKPQKKEGIVTKLFKKRK